MTRAILGTKHRKARQRWRTPRELVDALWRRWPFVLDVAALRHNRVVPHYIADPAELDRAPECVGVDALDVDVDGWAPATLALYDETRAQWPWCFCNPPFRRLGRFVDVAIATARAGVGVLLVAPLSFDSRWLLRAAGAGARIHVFDARVAFVPDSPDVDTSGNGAAFPCMIVEFHPAFMLPAGARSSHRSISWITLAADSVTLESPPAMKRKKAQMTLIDDVENERQGKKAKKKADDDAAAAAAETAREKRARELAREEARKVLDEEFPVVDDDKKADDKKADDKKGGAA